MHHNRKIGQVITEEKEMARNYQNKNEQGKVVYVCIRKSEEMPDG